MKLPSSWSNPAFSFSQSVLHPGLGLSDALLRSNGNHHLLLSVCSVHRTSERADDRSSSVFSCDCLLVAFQQDYTKTTEMICTEIGGGIEAGKNSLNFGEDPNQLLWLGIFFLSEVRCMLFDIALNGSVCSTDPLSSSIMLSTLQYSTVGTLCLLL